MKHVLSMYKPIRILCILLVGAAGLLPASARANFDQVEIHYLFNEYTEALQLLAQMAVVDPAAAATDVHHQVWVARCLVQIGETREAIEVFCRVIELDPAWAPDPVLVPAGEREVFVRAAQECGPGPALLSISSTPQGAQVWLDGQLLAERTPILDFQQQSGTYQLVLRLNGCEEFAGPIEVVRPATNIEKVLRPATPLPIPDDLPGDITRGPAIRRSMVLPGWGQFYKGQSTKGKVLLGAAGLTTGLAIYGYLQRDSRLDAYQEARADYLAAVSGAEINRTYAIYQEKTDAVRRSENLRDFGFYALIGVYVFNVVDAALGFPLTKANMQVRAGNLSTGQIRLALSFGGGGCTGATHSTVPQNTPLLPAGDHVNPRPGHER